MSEWQPPETAPTGEDNIIIAWIGWADGPCAEIGYLESGWFFCNHRRGGNQLMRAWMPAPLAPPHPPTPNPASPSRMKPKVSHE